MRKVFVALVVLLVAVNAMALDTTDLLATIAMPLAVAAVADVSGVQQPQLANLVVDLNQANVPPVQFVEVIRYVPVALVDQNGQPFIAFVEEKRTQGVTGTALVDAIATHLQTSYNVTPRLALVEPATTVVVRDDFIPPVVTTRVVSTDPLSLVALPLAVAAVADIAGVPQDQLANLVATLNNANMPASQIIEVVRYVPVALVDNGPQFVSFVQDQTTQGITGPALAPVIVQRLRTFYPASTQINITQPATVITPEPPPVVISRVTEVRAHPHGGPPGQIKKQLGLQTGAEVVHGQKPERQFTPEPTIVQTQPVVRTRPVRVEKHGEEHGEGHGKGHGRKIEAAPSPMTSAAPAPVPVPVAPPVVVAPQERAKGGPPAASPGQMKEQGGGQGKGKGKGKD